MTRQILSTLVLVPALVAGPAPKARPKLVVVIAVDQFSAELMQTYGP